jgi:hypothetical protein
MTIIAEIDFSKSENRKNALIEYKHRVVGVARLFGGNRPPAAL